MRVRDFISRVRDRLNDRFGGREVPKEVFFVCILAVVAVMGWALWRFTDNPYNDPAHLEHIYRDTEQWARVHKVDLRKDPLMARLYYQYNPKEKQGKDAPALPHYLR